MNKIFYVIIIFLVRANFALPQNSWKGEIKEINGIPTIFNSSQPICITPTIALQKVWQIGGEDPGFIMNIITSIDVDENGNIYVTDSSEKNVKVFSDLGELLFAFAKEGQGPGEFRSPECITIIANNLVLVIDPRIAYPMNRFNFFDSNGRFIDAYNINLRSQSYHKEINFNDQSSLLSQHKIEFSKLFSNNRLLLFSYATGNMKLAIKSLWLYDIFKREASEIITIKKNDPRLTNMEKQNDRMFLNIQWCHNNNGNIYLIEDVYEYNIHVYNSYGNLKKVLRREFNLPIKTNMEYEKALKKAKEVNTFYKNLGEKVIWEPLKENPIIFNLLTISRSMFCDDKNRLWILTNESLSTKKSKEIFSSLFKNKTKRSIDEKPTHFSFDIFSPEGKYLMKIPFDANQPRCFIYKKGFIYFADLGEDGFPWLYKYQILEIND